jgi:DNA replication and repair protein RecF
VLETVAIENFRCLREARLEFDPRATVVWGDNGSGKTSLLEALFFVGSGRSFRTHLREQLVMRGADFMRVVARCREEIGEVSLGAEWTSSGTRLRIAGRSVRSAVELAEALPLQVIDPGVHRLIEEGSSRRRRLLDWGVFHVKHEFMPAWRRYHRALQQRNAALRSGATAHEVSAWDSELASAGSAVDAARTDYLAVLEPHFKVLASELLPDSAELKYRPGWSGDGSLEEAIRRARTHDLRVRFTTVGAHRADLRFGYAGRAARECVSRGEQKMLAVTFILAQIRCLASVAQRGTCLLLDDPAAELDVDNLGKLLRVVANLPAQLVATAVNRDSLSALGFGRMFHVKQGQFHAVL